jgi:hypothetical protein
MATWGIGTFENDTACDFAGDIAEGNLASLEESLDRVLTVRGDYLEASDAAEALAAVDIIARLKGNGGEQTAYTEAIDRWIERQPSPPQQVMVKGAPLRRPNSDRAVRNAGALAGDGRLRRVEALDRGGSLRGSNQDHRFATSGGRRTARPLRLGFDLPRWRMLRNCN